MSLWFGEIRDTETATIAIKAAQTGHLVLSTLHTNSKQQKHSVALNKWTSLAGSIRLIIAQRLVRTLCPHCKKEASTPIEVTINQEIVALKHWYAAGCERCYSGYYGRAAIFELLVISDALRFAIINGESTATIHTLAIQQGMETLFENGYPHGHRRQTSMEEVIRVLGVF
ncbi:unnamed protein product [Ranitomeya imitator]|uniref:Bacterial type II secretion system protein E domain-containing protein n=1 Tax=Ranitomeya imitator TaxID=111125 RepID=A0ABN9MAZ9_9NEOB|nr:unnamed protein product [Ranitomeya imitator]